MKTNHKNILFNQNQSDSDKLSTILEKNTYLENEKNKINDITLISPSTNYQDNTIKNLKISSLTNNIKRISNNQQCSKSLNYSKSQTIKYVYKDSSEYDSTSQNKKNDFKYKENENSEFEISDKIKEIDEKLKIRQSSVVILDNRLIEKRGSISDDEFEELSEKLKILKCEINDLKNLRIVLSKKLNVNLKKIEERNKKISFLKEENARLKKNLNYFKNTKLQNQKKIIFSFKEYDNSKNSNKNYLTPENNLKSSFTQNHNFREIPIKINQEPINQNKLNFWQKDSTNNSSAFLKKSENKFSTFSKNENLKKKKEINHNKIIISKKKINLNNYQNSQNHFKNDQMFNNNKYFNQNKKIINPIQKTYKYQKNSISSKKTENFEIKNKEESENIFKIDKIKNSLTLKKNTIPKNVMKYKVVPYKLSMEETLLSTLTTELDKSRVISSKNFNKKNLNKNYEKEFYEENLKNINDEDEKNNFGKNFIDEKKNIFEIDPDEFFNLKKKNAKKSKPNKKSYLIGQTIFSKKKSKSKPKDINKIDLNFEHPNFVFEEPVVKKVVSRRNVFK